MPASLSKQLADDSQRSDLLCGLMPVQARVPALLLYTLL